MATYIGKDITLRPLGPEDVTDRYLDWFRDTTVTQFLSARNLQREEVIRYMQKGPETGTYYMLALCIRETGLHVGNVKIGPIDLQHRTSDLVTVIGDRAYWGKGLATEAIRLATQVAFAEYDIRKVYGSIMQGNVGSIKSYTRGGWHIECVRKGQYLVNGEVQDEVCVGCFNPKYFPDA